MSVKSEVMNEGSVPEPTAAVCSCTECDSDKCFEKRYQASKNCACKKCKNSKTCLFYSNKNLNESLPNVTMKPNKPVVKNGISNTRPISKVKCRSQGLGTTRMRSFSSSTADKGHQEESDGTKTFIHKQTKHSHNEMPEQSAGREKEDEVTLVQSMTVSYSNADITSSTGKLTAQIMNVPYKDFKNSISFHKPKISKTKLTKIDILQRIKDAYNACSCIVCECIATISPVQQGTCNCKPCECDDCKNGKPKLTDTLNKIEKNENTFFETRNELLSQKQCECESCQCLECQYIANRKTPIKTMIVAPVEDNHLRNCQCNPCGCFECGHVYGTINTNVTHEMSTGISRHPTCRCETCLNEACERDGADACQCERRSKIMRKPVERDTHDFDIRRAEVSSDNKTTLDDKTSTKYDTIAMFTTLSEKIPETAESECKDEIANTFKIPQNYDFVQNLYNKLQEPNACKCSPCDCEICTNREVVEKNRNCKCDVCDCIRCANLNRPFCSNKNVIVKALNTSSKHVCDSEPCERLECRRDRSNNHKRWIVRNKTTEIVEPISKSQLLTFSVSKTKYSDLNINTRCYDKSVSPYSQVSVAKNSDQDLFIYHTSQQHENNYQSSLVRNTITKCISPQSGTYNDEKDTCVANHKKSIVKFDINVQSKCRELNLLSGNSKDYNASGSYTSAFATCATTSRILYNNESGSVSPVSLRQHTNSWDGSCNSSGHDYSDYLIQFPRKTVETCINDVMNLRYERKLSFNQLNTPLKSVNIDSPIRKLSYFNQNLNSTMHLTQAGHIYYPKVCKNWNVENSCECDQCFCDKCTYKKLKFKKCNCECSSCSCRGMCLREDFSILIRKSESTQTNQKVVSDRGQDNAADELRSKPNCCSFIKAKILPDLQEFEVSKDEDTLIQKDKPKSLNDSFSTENNIINDVKDDSRHRGYGSKDSYLNNNLDLLSVNIYESVHKTIKEARAFSIDLMNILQKYEKANIEFESVSQKLKQSDKETLDTNNALNTKESPQIETKNKEKANDNTENKTETSYLEHKDKEPVIDKSSDDFTKNDFDIAVVKTEDKHKLTNNTNYHMTFDSIKNDKPKTTLHVNNENDSNLSKCSDDEKKYKDIKEKHEVRTFKKCALDIIIEVLTNMDIDPSKVQENRNTYKKYRKLIKRAAITAKRKSDKSNDPNELSIIPDISLENVDENELTPLSKQTPLSETIKQSNNIIEKDGEQRNVGVPVQTASKGVVSSIVAGSIDVISCRKTLDSSDEIKRRNQNQGPNEAEKNNHEKRKSWQEKKKHFILNPMPFDKYKVEKTPYLELEVKGAVECISPKTGKTIESRKAIAAPYKYKALGKDNLLHDVKKTHKMVILQRQDKTRQDKSERNQSTSNIDFDISSVSFSQMQCVLKENSKEVVSSFSKGTNSMIPERVKNDVHIPYFKHFMKESYLKPAVKGHSFECGSTSLDGIDATRVQFQTVRKVSDHTILVKWSAPRDITGVKGYELLVDGRAVKKIFGPTSCMAVVTCLPATSDKMVVTIRTIKSGTRQQARNATTTVYDAHQK